MKHPKNNPYMILGVDKNASQEEIKTAYKKLIFENHPDKGGEVKKAQEINDAYDVLGDENKRKQYDNPQPQFQHGNPFQHGGFHFDINNIFEHIYRQQQGNFISVKQIHQEANVSLADVLKNKELEIEIQAIQKKIKLPIPKDFVSGKTLTIKISENNNQILILNLKLHLVIPSLTNKQRDDIIEILK